MADNVTLPPLDTVDNSSFITELNENLDTLADEFDEVIYKDGHEAMTGDLDMGSNRIFNLPLPVNPTEPIRLADIDSIAGGEDAENPNYTYVINTLPYGSPATLVASGIYPNITLTFGIPQGAPGASGALSDGTFGDITVSGSGTVLTVGNKKITFAKLADLAGAGVIGGTGAGVPSLLSFATIKSNLSLVKGDVGLGNVDNTSDVNKPVSTAQAAAITTAITTENTSGKIRTLPIMAGAMTSRASNGAFANSAEIGTNKINLVTLDFDGSTDEFAQFSVPMPKSWDEGTVTAKFIWRSPAGTGNVIWTIKGVALKDDDAIDTAFGTAVSVTDSVTAVGDIMHSAYSSPITIGNTPSNECMVQFEVSRDADNVSDTSTVDAQLIGVVLKYNETARDDS